MLSYRATTPNNVIPSKRSLRVYLADKPICQNMPPRQLTRYTHTQCYTKGISI